MPESHETFMRVKEYIAMKNRIFIVFISVNARNMGSGVGSKFVNKENRFS